MEGLISLRPSRRPPLLLCYTEEEPLAWYAVRERAPGEFEGRAQCVG
jgi:hypothetical protein